MIVSIRGSERWVAGFKSESWPASDRNRWPASYWNAWPASSESAVALTKPLERLQSVEGRARFAIADCAHVDVSSGTRIACAAGCSRTRLRRSASRCTNASAAPNPSSCCQTASNWTAQLRSSLRLSGFPLELFLRSRLKSGAGQGWRPLQTQTRNGPRPSSRKQHLTESRIVQRLRRSVRRRWIVRPLMLRHRIQRAEFFRASCAAPRRPKSARARSRGKLYGDFRLAVRSMDARHWGDATCMPARGGG